MNNKKNALWSVSQITISLFLLIFFVLEIGIYGKTERLMTQIATFVFPTISPFVILLSVINVMIAIVGLRFVSKKYAKIIMLVTLSLGILVNVITTGNMGKWSHVVKENGGNYSFLESVFGVSYCGSEEPDSKEVYRTVDGEELGISIYKSKSKEKNLPVYVYIHGGGWTNNHSETLSGMHRSFADEGFVGFSINYRLGTEENSTWDKALEDCAYALKWIYENAESYGGDKNNIIVFGESAGGNLALIYSSASASGKINELYGIDVPVPKATCVLYPVVDVRAYATSGRFFSTTDPVGFDTPYLGGTVDEYPDRLAFVLPENYITEKTPATFIIHGEKDSLVTVEGSKSFVKKAKECGVETKLVILPYCNHASEVMTNNMTQQADKTMFISWLRKIEVIKGE